MVVAQPERSSWIQGVSRAAPVVPRAVGQFYATSLDAFRYLFTSRFQWREFVQQFWFIASISIVPALAMSIPFCMMFVYEINILLFEVGAVDLSGAGAGVAIIREIGPIITVLVVAGAGSTAICADLGSRTIREEIDAMRVLGIDPIQRLCVPRIVASTAVAVFLNGLVSAVGIIGGFVATVYLQGASPGQYVTSIPIITGLPDFFVSEIKAGVFGLLAGLVACHLGLNAKGGPKGVGDAVNQTVVYAFLLLFLANSVITTIALH
ncbi:MULTISPECIES: ABC transporter permease [unclassified Gordonia (in: high G+C Gram-positive bacteria)]|uniref:MlaE family ABC transporter permease n=1 Tax=unclassified Gordonia (in: high G+C Gram-positive bacteria) TaxID=2657482 RepID=UPI0009AD5252|nr:MULTISPECIES: ABC transporter permease [unclassified Gordonia (in: high G+C Gram-positive bacteria)]MDF3284146.1 ABC transporter permease [Gordonia sp. N1V]OPX16587.1 ABC transporter permease [Gordonia sp. i37]